MAIPQKLVVSFQWQLQNRGGLQHCLGIANYLHFSIEAWEKQYFDKRIYLFPKRLIAWIFML